MKAVAAILLSCALPAFASDVKRGDVFRTAVMTIMCPTPPLGALYSGDLTFKTWIATGGVVAFDSVGNLYAAGDSALQIFDTTLRPVRTIALSEAPIALAVNDAGVSFVAGTSGNLRVYSPGGVLQQAFMLPNVAPPVSFMSIDVAPDGCTLVYTGANDRVNRFDVCARVALPPIAQDRRFTAVRALRDGGFAGATDTRIELWNGSGQLIHSVALPPERFNNRPVHVEALAFDVDPNFVVIATDTGLMKLNIRNPAIVKSDFLSNPIGVAVFGEARPAASEFAAPVRQRGIRH